jgi:hypothetical protein
MYLHGCAIAMWTLLLQVMAEQVIFQQLQSIFSVHVLTGLFALVLKL